MPEKNITFEIKEHLGTIAKYESGWNKELNVISWNGATAKYDIREWDEHHVRMKRGITLSQWEMRRLVDLYISRNNDRAVARGKAIEAERQAIQIAALEQNEETTEEAPSQDVEGQETEIEVETELQHEPKEGF